MPLSRESIILLDDAVLFAQVRGKIQADTDDLLVSMASGDIHISRYLERYRIDRSSLINTIHLKRRVYVTRPSQRKSNTKETIESRTVFISYSRTDWESYVRPLVDHLHANRIPIWIDQHLIQGGDDWLDAINIALKMCGRMILCISPEALLSKYVKMEYRYFIDEHKPLIPVICRPAELTAELRRLHYLSYGQVNNLAGLLKGAVV
jgi:hypothetical protein